MVEVTTVCCKGCGGEGDDCAAGGAGETGDEFAAGVAGRDISACVSCGVFMGDASRKDVDVTPPGTTGQDRYSLGRMAIFRWDNYQTH